MRLPPRSWEKTLRTFGLRWKTRPRPAHRKPRQHQLETLERREVMAAEIDVQDTMLMSVPDNTGSVSFGTSPAGTPITKSFTIQNTGMDSLTIDVNSFSLPSGYTLTQAPAATVTSWASTSFTVRLDATVAGTYSGQLSFGNSDADENPYNFSLSGTVQSGGGGGGGGANIAVVVDLLNDTGEFPSDNITDDSRLSVSVTGEFASGMVRVQFDHQTDQNAEGRASAH